MQHAEDRRVFCLGILTITLLFCAGSLVAEQEKTDELQPAGLAVGTSNSPDAGTSAECASDSIALDLPANLNSESPRPMTCTATANCESGQVSCTGCLSDMQDANCPSQNGWVSCGGTKTWCAPCGTAFCVQSSSCGLFYGGSCGSGGTHPGVCYQGSCRCWCTQGTSCQQDQDCGPDNSGGQCVGGSCYCD